MLVSISLLGFGNVGRGVARVLLEKKNFFKRKYGIEFKVVSISDSTATIWDEGGIDLKEALMVKENFGALKYWGSDYEIYHLSPIEVAEEVESDVFIDVTTANPEAYKWHMEAFRQGRHVVTSNKPPLVFYYTQLVQEAAMRGVNYRFEATVMAGTPIITLLQESLKGDEVISIEGIFNGTTTFILSEMEKGLTFEEALKKAQSLGIAEANPDVDIKGFDAAYKATILHDVAFEPISFKKVKIRGIDEIKPENIKNAQKNDNVIRLVAKIERKNVIIEPKKVSKNSILAVYGTSNVAVIRSDLAGEIILKGSGAGVKEAASAVVSDIIKAVKKE